MFQSFEATTRPDQGPPRLAALREQMARERLDAFLVPRADAHQGETVAPRDARLEWLTGFTGSAGIAAVLREGAALFADGRYRLQARAQTAEEVEIVPWPDEKPGPWLAARLGDGARVGHDPWLHTIRDAEAMARHLAAKGADLVATDNLVDRIWTDQPPPPHGAAFAQPLEHAGESHDDKRARLAATLREAGHDSAILTLPDSIAWLLNIRGADIPRNPVVLAFAILHADASVDLFAEPAKLAALGEHLGPDVRVQYEAAFGPALGALRGTVRIDRDTAPAALPPLVRAGGAEVVYDEDPCILPKACKNAAEIDGARAAQLRDGAAICEFLAWLDAQPPGSLTEIDVVEAMEGFRRATNALHDIAFDAIAGAGEHGAIVHYRVTEDTNRRIEAGDLLLIDSGGQYVDGTTDVTRTIAIGDPVGEDERRAYTRVLQGMIAISRARWPRGLAGRDLDALARAPLWMAGQDYDHGTGHGIGAFLGVHEGPQRLSRMSEVPLRPGMILSNEPGYYREGAFGVRIENLVVVREAPPVEGGDGRDMLDFETLTFVPLDRRLIVAAMLSPDERAWIDAYHAEVASRIGPRLGARARDWLAQATAPL